MRTNVPNSVIGSDHPRTDDPTSERGENSVSSLPNASLDTVLRVESKRWIADRVVELTLVDPAGSHLPGWSPGAHIDIDLTPSIVRQYSLCGDASDRSCYKVAVLREPASRGGSAHVHETLVPGDLLHVRGPRNNFPFVDADEYIFIAGGIGVTPLIPMIAHAAAAARPWTLLYGGRERAGMAYLEALTGYGPSVTVWPQDSHGLLDLVSLLGTPQQGAAVYCCGPEGLIAAVENQCQSWPPDALHVERFSPKPKNADVVDEPFEVELSRSGLVVAVPAGTTVVDALADAGVEIETSCREGICGYCETPVLSGRPQHRDSLLSEAERAANKTMMLCVSRSCDPRLVLDL